jgi:hypothetical protein
LVALEAFGRRRFGAWFISYALAASKNMNYLQRGVALT